MRHGKPKVAKKTPGPRPIYKQRLAKPEPDDMPHRGKKFKKLKGVMI